VFFSPREGHVDRRVLISGLWGRRRKGGGRRWTNRCSQKDHLAFLEDPYVSFARWVRLPRFDKFALQTLGFGLTVIGLILLFISLLTGGPESCPSGCVPGVFFWYYVVRDAEFFLSLAFIVLGIVLIIVAIRMKATKETNTVAVHAPASG